MRNLIPHFIHQQFERQIDAGRFRAAAMFVDVSGFTHMTETLMAYEVDGAEVLADALNRVFSPPVAQVYAHGGFISSFAGDAFTALFPLDTAGDDAPHHALHTASAIQAFFAQHGRLETRHAQFEIGAKIGLSLGEVRWGILGGAGRHTYTFRGPTIDASTRAEAQAKTGDVIADARIWSAVQPAGQAQAIDIIPPAFRLTDRFPSMPPISSPPPRLSRQALAPFVIDAALDLMASGAQAEFRRVATAFVSFEEPRSRADLDAFATLAMDVADDYGGYFNKLDFGDKGPVMLVLFGAPVTHENDVERAANFLLSLRERASLRFRAGLTDGPVYAGLIGGTERCEFTAIGNGVNFAARLMEKADWGQIFVPGTVTEQPQLAVSHVGDFHYKGFSDPQPTYSLLGLETGAERFFDQPMVGRQVELAQLAVAAQPIFESRFAGVAAIYGEAGIGKSHLAHELHQALRQRGNVAWFTGQSDQTLRQAFNPFIYFIKRYFNQTPEATPAENRARFESRLARLITNLQDLSPTDAETQDRITTIIGELTRTQSILGALIGLHWPNSLYESLDAKLRYQNTLSTVRTLLLAESQFHPVVLEIEDLQWVDSSSHEALTVLTRDAAHYPLFILVTSRYADDGSKPSLALPDDVPVTTIDLNVLAPADLKHLARIILNGPVSDELLALLQERTQANPFFAQQFLYYFQENDLLERPGETGAWSIKSDVPADVPTTINAILIARVDRLEQRVKRVVKSAAVLGREFDDGVLARMLEDDVTPEVQAAERAQIWSEVR